MQVDDIRVEGRESAACPEVDRRSEEDPERPRANHSVTFERFARREMPFVPGGEHRDVVPFEGEFPGETTDVALDSSGMRIEERTDLNDTHGAELSNPPLNGHRGPRPRPEPLTPR